MSLAHKRYMAKQYQELLGDNPTPMERVLVSRILMNSIALQAAESDHIMALAENREIYVLEFHNRRIDRAQRRYLSSIKALAQLRRLKFPLIGQLNVATNQVNLAVASSAPGLQSAQAPPELPLASPAALLEGPDAEGSGD